MEGVVLYTRYFCLTLYIFTFYFITDFPCLCDTFFSQTSIVAASAILTMVTIVGYIYVNQPVISTI